MEKKISCNDANKIISLIVWHTLSFTMLNLYCCTQQSVKKSKYHLRFCISQTAFWTWNIIFNSSGDLIFLKEVYIHAYYIKERGELAVIQFDWHRLHSDNDICMWSRLMLLNNELCDSPTLWLSSAITLRKLLCPTKPLFPYIPYILPHEITVEIQKSNIRTT